MRQAAILFVILCICFYFAPILAAAFIALGVIDVLRNQQKNAAMFERYFLGNGMLTWVAAPFNLAIDLLCYRNKGIYKLEDISDERRKEIEGVLQVFDDRRDEIVAQVDRTFESGRRGMFVYRWFGQRQNQDIAEFNEPFKYLQTVAVSVFQGKESTSFHFAPADYAARSLQSHAG